MRDIKPLLILLLSIGLVGTWAYHIYDKTQYSRMLTADANRDSVAITSNLKDSLNMVYNSTIKDLDARLSSSADTLDQTKAISDSLQRNLAGKVSEINRLKGEIASILGKEKVSPQEMETARGKIAELQEKVSELENQNLSMEEEKKQLTATLQQLTENSDREQQTMKRLRDENISLAEKINLASYLIASDLQLSAVNIRSSAEQVTKEARKADKFVISFILQNNVNSYSNAEVVIVIVQPDRKVLQSSNWDSGQFDTKDGKKDFTRIIKFDYAKSERKELLFSLDNDDFQKGAYQLQVWHKGMQIGQTVTVLN